MQVVKSVGVLSCAKIMGAIYAALGLLFLPFFLIAGVASMASGEKESAFAAIGFVTLAILAPVFYGILGLVAGALGAWLYNVFAGWLGGVQIELQPISPAIINPAGVAGPMQA